MESTWYTFSIDNFFSKLGSAFLASNIVVFKLCLNSFLDFGPLWDFGLNLWIKLFPHFSFQPFFFLDKIPDSLILDLKELDPSFVFLKNHFLFCELSWQIVRVNVNWSFNGFGNQLFGLLLQVFRAQKERYHASWWIVGRNTADLWFHVGEITEFMGQSIKWLKIFLKLSHFMMQYSKLSTTWSPQPFQHFVVLNFCNLLDSTFYIPKNYNFFTSVHRSWQSIRSIFCSIDPFFK